MFAFAAAYPPFLFIDEFLHFETVVKFARVGLPARGEDVYDGGAVRLLVEHGFHSAGNAGASSPQQRQRAMEAEARALSAVRNPETFTPPVYYALAAAWYRLGQVMGIDGAELLYWVRLPAAPLYGLAMWLGCRTCLRFHAARPELAVAVGILLVALPQDVLYTINCDVASPAAVALTLYLLAAWLHRPGSVLLAASSGSAAAAAMLVKYTNAGVLGAVLVAVLLSRRQRQQRQQGDRRSTEVVMLLLCTAAPIAAWMIYCKLQVGDWTGTGHRADIMRWTTLPLWHLPQHPIFGPGVIDFLWRLCVTFWRGELIWGGLEQRVDALDGFYAVVTLLGVLGAGGWLVRPSATARAERPLALLYAITVAGSILFLAYASTRFDFGSCLFPSRGFPYFASGRLLSGSTVPFAILLTGGLYELVPLARRGRVVVALSAFIAMVCLASEIYLCCCAGDDNVVASPQNFYRMLSSTH